MVGETRSKSWWKQAISLHCGWMWPTIQFTGLHLFCIHILQQELVGVHCSRLCEFILYRDSEARMGFKFIEVGIVEDEMQGCEQCLKIMYLQQTLCSGN
jgi:hypothetical protein